jgi:hypothetical protein
LKTKSLKRRPANISGPRIRVARLARHPALGQVELAARLAKKGLRLTQASVARIELQQRCVTDYELLVIARCLKTTVGWLCREQSAKRSLSPSPSK